ncbi:Protein-methionine sulfoxide oxidase MICAL2 [Trichinella nelsoni]|uniref:Protein-methionine sulfoxide oxidase MICAL2 n=1 Tax=Trichinella nelsoni TaxID=6336 RepID=A0A0V0RM47_9BILA|nr:Protein-methionine sulfoxide oxidase MICAL2 [Trichinella nelsoni]
MEMYFKSATFSILTTRLISRLSMERTENECLRTAMKMFIEASTLESALVAYGQLISLCKANRSDNYEFYKSIRDKFNWWKVKQLWEMLDKRYMNREYLNQQAGKDLRVLVVGAGPCGLRLAIECAFLGAKVFVLEKRESFVRNNLLHLWPYAEEDLKNLGARILYPKFSVGSTTHISVSSLQLILLKVALLVGVEVYENVAFYKLIEPKMNSNGEISGWKAALIPENHVLADYQFNVLIDASGKQNTVTGFSYKEFQGRFSIGITANFINNNTKMERLMNECLYDMSYFNGLNFLRKLKANAGIELENFAYHKGDMHHFTMTAKKQNLLNRGIIVQNADQDLELLDEKNICHEKLLAYVLDGVNFATNNLAMNLEFALNENNLPDVTMFSFTSFFKAEHSSRFEYKQGRPLLLALVGDSLQKPIWNSGSSIGRGFMSALDAAWMIRSFGCGRPILELLAEKECNYQLLTQVTPCTLQGNVTNYTIDPCTRYYLTDNLSLPNKMPPLLSSDSHGFLIEEHYSLPSVSYTEDVKFQQLNALFNWLQSTFAFHHRRLHDLMSLFNNGTILGMIICHYISQKAKEIVVSTPSELSANLELCFQRVRSLWGIEAPDDTKDYEQVCEYLSKIKQKIEEETPTMVKTMGQTKSEEWMEKSVHNGIQPNEVSKNASVEGLKEKEKSQQKTANENDESQRWRLNSERTTVMKADTALRQTLNNNQMKCKSTTSSAKKKLYPAFLQRMIKALGSQLRQRIFKRKSMKNINEVNIYAGDSTVVNPLAQHGLQTNNDKFQSVDSGSGEICRTVSKDCSNMGATAKETHDVIDKNGDKVEGDKESEKKTKPTLLQGSENSQTSPIVIDRRVRKSLDPALLQKMNNLLGPQFKQHVNQQKSVENIKKMNILAEDSTVEHPQAQQAMQLNNDQFQSTDSFSRHMCRIISTDCSSMGTPAKETSNDNNENSDRVDRDRECEDKMESELLQIADNNQTPPIVIERRVRKSLDPALLQKMNNLLGPQFKQHVNQQKSVKNIKKMNILAEDSTVEHPQAQQAMQLNNDQFQSTDSFSRHICKIISTDCSSMGTPAKETSNDNNENGDRVDRDQECEDKMESELLQIADNNQTPPIVIERQVRKSLDPALLQKMNSLLGPQFRQHVNQQKSVKNIEEVNIYAGHLTIINSLNKHDFQPRNGQFQSIDSCSEQIYSIKGIDYSNREATVKEITNVNKENANRVHIYNESEKKMNPALLQVVENGQTLPIVIERRVRRTFDPALLQRMNNQLKPQLRQHVTQQRSVKNIQKMKTASMNSATVNPQTENALQARNAQFQSTDSGSEQICRIISIDCSSTGAFVKEISNDIIENGDRVNRGKNSKEKTEPKLIHIVDNNQTLPMILERQERKPLDPALLQGMSNMLGPQLQQPVTQRNSMQNIKDMKTIAVDSAVVNSLTQHGLQLNNDQFQFFDSCSGKLDNDINAAFSVIAESIAEMVNDDGEDGRST